MTLPMFPLSQEQREAKRKEVCELMNAIRHLDEERKKFLAEHKDHRGPLQERVLTLLEDLGEEG